MALFSSSCIICAPFVDLLPTTEVLRRDQKGSCVAVHLFSWALQAEMRRTTCVGFVAVLISERVLAQKQLLTSHMKEKTTVTRKSCSGQKELKGKMMERSHTGDNMVTLKCFLSQKQKSCWDIRGFFGGKNSLTTSGPLLFFRYLSW